MRRIRNFMLRMAYPAAALLYPAVCRCCGRRVASDGGICGNCWGNVRFLERPWCDCLGTPFALDLGARALSAEAIANPPLFERARAAVAYDGPAQQLVRRLKFHDGTELAPMMAQWMVRVATEMAHNADLVVPVPLHRRRMLQRRYNQSAELARCLAGILGLAFEPSAVARIRGTRQQVGLDARQRETNVRGAFGVPGRANLDGRRVLLIDDVYTTGATVSAVARALKQGGARTVDVLTFARVLPEDFAA